METDALRRRVDLKIARIEADTLAKSFGLTNATRFINLLEVAGVSRSSATPVSLKAAAGVARSTFKFRFSISARCAFEGSAKPNAGRQCQRESGQCALGGSRGVPRLSVKLRHRRAFRSDVLPLRKTIADETMLRYGAMQIDVFALLSEARQRIAANMAATEAQRNFGSPVAVSTPRSAAAPRPATAPRLRPAPRNPDKR